jgi:hypothetical protein
VNVFAADVPAAVITVTLAEMLVFPELTSSGAVTDAGKVIFVVVNSVGVIVVVLVEVFHTTCVPLTKLLPLSVNVTVGLPAPADVGLRDERTGFGSNTKVAAAEVPPAVVVTVTAAVPAVWMSALGTDALITEVLTEVVVSVAVALVAVFFHFTVVALFTKLAPLIVSVNAGEPGAADRGLKLVISGLTGSIVNVFAVEEPAAVVTVTLARMFVFPELTSSGVVTDGAKVIVFVVILVADGVIVVVFVGVFQTTFVPATKLLPLSVNVTPGLPAMADVGLRDDRMGLGSKAIASAVEIPPAVVVTVTVAVPAVLMSELGTDAWSREVLLKVIANGVATPVVVFFHFTVVAFITKSAPLIVSVNAGPPGVTNAGLRLVISGLTASIEKDLPADLVPALETVTAALPFSVIRPAGTSAVSSLEFSNFVPSSCPAQ